MRAEIDMAKTMKNSVLEVKLTGYKPAMFRIRCMVWLMRLAVFVGGVGGIDITDGDKPEA